MFMHGTVTPCISHRKFSFANSRQELYQILGIKKKIHNIAVLKLLQQKKTPFINKIKDP
jgi:hypothetical protein